MSRVKNAGGRALETYVRNVRQDWGTPIGATGLDYAANVYIARIVSAVVNVPGVVNATNVQINGADTDLTLTENGTTQQVPVMGTVTLSAAT